MSRLTNLIRPTTKSTTALEAKVGFIPTGWVTQVPQPRHRDSRPPNPHLGERRKEAHYDMTGKTSKEGSRYICRINQQQKSGLSPALSIGNYLIKCR